MAPGRGARTLLIVDDDSLLCDGLHDHFTAAGLRVLSAQSGAEALEIARTQLVDIVILDQKLPDTQGHLLCGPILEASEHAKIIFVTGHPSFDNALQAIRAGAYDYVSKPFGIAELGVVVDRCLETLRLERTDRLQRHRREAESDAARLLTAGSGLAGIIRLAELAAASEAPVLVTGETGTGKSLVAKYIHYKSRRRDSEFITVNCAALPEGLIEAELFGYEKGTFTGAIAAREGLFEMAEEGTLFLDEIAELTPALQSKLLNVLEDKSVRRLGGKASRRVDFRLIAATNADLEGAVQKGAIRADLFYRLNVLRIHVPSLRERRGDIPGLCGFLLERLAGRAGVSLSEAETASLMHYAWPGNVRELANLLERALLLQEGELRPSALLPSPHAAGGVSQAVARPPGIPTMEEVERQHLALALERTSGNLTRAARLLGISLSTLRRKVRTYRLRPEGQNGPVPSGTTGSN